MIIAKLKLKLKRKQYIKIKVIVLKIIKASNENKSVINEIVDIHLATFKGFFLTFMGKGFLKQMYKAYTTHPESDIFVALDDDNKVAGFLAYSENLSGL